jgi:asparagine synthase (glutamine-hydrolysing)
LPATVIRRKKTGFGAPLRSWAQGEGQPFIRERLLDGSFLRRGIFDPSGIESLIGDNAHGRIDGAYTLFSLLSIESWLRQFAAPA